MGRSNNGSIATKGDDEVGKCDLLVGRGLSVYFPGNGFFGKNLDLTMLK